MTQVAYNNFTELLSVNTEPQRFLDTWLFRLPNDNHSYPLNSLFGVAQLALGALASILHGYFTSDAPTSDTAAADRETQSIMVTNPLQRLYPAVIPAFDPEDPDAVIEDLANVVDNTEMIFAGMGRRCAFPLYPGDSVIYDVSKLSRVSIRNPNVGAQDFEFIDVIITFLDKDE